VGGVSLKGKKIAVSACWKGRICTPHAMKFSYWVQTNPSFAIGPITQVTETANPGVQKCPVGFHC